MAGTYSTTNGDTMPALRIIGTSTLVHPTEDGFTVDSPHAPWPIVWSAEYLREQIRIGTVLTVTEV
jgi:hypothetical protein